MRTQFLSSVLLVIVGLGAGCAPLMGSLRRDLDDSEPGIGSPVTGGQWSERGFLSESMGESGNGDSRYGTLGHSDRSPASLTGGTDPRETLSGSSWSSEARADANRRDGVRGTEGDEEGATFSNTATLQPKNKRQYKNGSRATRADFTDESPNEGSLWASDGQTNYYFTKNKIRGVGDIVTVTLNEDLVRDFGLEIRRNLTPLERGKELALAQERLRAKAYGRVDAKDSIGSSSAAPDRAPASGKGEQSERKMVPGEPPEVPIATMADIDVGKSVEVKTGDTMLAEIVERYPNGNYKIRGTKKVAYRNGTSRVMTLIGIVRSSDIGEDDVVNSGKLYEYRLEALR